MSQVDLLRQGVEFFGSHGGTIGSIVKWMGYSVVIFAFLGALWKLFVNRTPPGQAGPWSSWNKIMKVSSCKNADCTYHACDHKKHRIAWKGLRPRVSLRKKCRLASCDRKLGPCASTKAKISWEGVTLKLPWRKTHLTNLSCETDSIDPVVIDMEDEQGKKSQVNIQGLIYWRIIVDRNDDGPYRASEIFVKDKNRYVINRVTSAVRRAQAKYKITEMVDNPEEVYRLVNGFCSEKLHVVGIEMVDFELAETTRAGQQVLADALIEAARLSAAPPIEPLQKMDSIGNGYHGEATARAVIIASESLAS